VLRDSTHTTEIPHLWNRQNLVQGGLFSNRFGTPGRELLFTSEVVWLKIADKMINILHIDQCKIIVTPMKTFFYRA